MVALAPPLRAVERFGDRLLADDLPGLSAARRTAALAFTTSRVAVLPSPMAVGVGAIALAVGAVSRLLGRDRTVRLLARRDLPLFGEYVRMIRSLAYAFIWETWPDTRADGSPS